MPTDQPVRRVVAVVVTFNRRRLLETLVARLAEVRERTPALVDVLVVDNASTDGTAAATLALDALERAAVAGGPAAPPDPSG